MNRVMNLLIPLIIFATLGWSGVPEKAQLLSPEETLVLLEDIKESAIVFGEGDKEIHTFIDPYCSMSQRYLRFIFERKEVMFKKYKIYLYLYELPRKRSKEAIRTILSSDYQQIMLKQIMLDHADVPPEDNGDADDIMEEISDVAEQIGVFKRPYILINGKVK